MNKKLTKNWQKIDKIDKKLTEKSKLTKIDKNWQKLTKNSKKIEKMKSVKKSSPMC